MQAGLVLGLLMCSIGLSHAAAIAAPAALAQMPEGRQFLADTAFGSLIPVAAGELRRLDPYLPETKRLLEGTH